MFSRGVLLKAVLVAAIVANAAPAVAQTADDLFNDQSMQRIDLWVNTRDWYLLRVLADTRAYVPANLKWNGITVTNVAIRIRGTGSLSAAKPALKIDFNRYATGRTFLGLKALSLNNVWQDASGLRELLAMKVYRTLGLPASRMAPVALYINNEYAGYYLVVEEIDEPFLARAFGESGGYLFEYKWISYYYFDYLGADLAPYAARYEPRTRATESDGALYLPVEEMVRTVNEAPDEDFPAVVSPYIDLEAFMRLTAAQAAVAEPDGLLGGWGMNNHYLYRSGQRAPHRFVPWDASVALAAADYPVHAWHAENVLMRRAMAAPSLKQRYRDTLLEAADLFDRTEAGPPPAERGPGWLEREAARLLELIRPAVSADSLKPFTAAEFEAGATDVLTFARTRGAFVRQEVGRLWPQPIY
jgi:spore coat protein CotH